MSGLFGLRFGRVLSRRMAKGAVEGVGGRMHVREAHVGATRGGWLWQ